MPDVMSAWPSGSEPPKPTAFIGIDPGVSGGLAILYRDLRVVVEVHKMPKMEKEVWDIIDAWSTVEPNVFACIELVGGYVGGYNRGEGDDGSTSNPGSAMFTFGQSYGGLRMALVAASIPFEAVRPQAWQKALGLTKEKDSQAWAETHEHSSTRWKNALKAEAQHRFPDVKVTLRTADALLLAEYARMKWG